MLKIYTCYIVQQNNLYLDMRLIVINTSSEINAYMINVSKCNTFCFQSIKFNTI